MEKLDINSLPQPFNEVLATGLGDTGDTKEIPPPSQTNDMSDLMFLAAILIMAD